ncbi:ferredoxin [Mycobacterium kyogaense]|uniref:ferredoxin n=1 Tax=Mycobacterium kyogaense TaxID=2212479 RepID=UPI000DABFDB1|nr:ferredoxin [Mycobacterium kyogaense]
MSELRSVDVDGTHVTVDRSKCIGSGNCIMWAEATFDLDESELVILNEGADDSADAIVEAARNCPAGAITAEQN